jgi:DNA-binding CsgD family transcriptional regulator/N-acetylneuraminic acid mutarotase
MFCPHNNHKITKITGQRHLSDQETTTPQLSVRELEVLQLVATGASNQQIARELVISVNTVKVHLRKIYEKLGVQSRTEATMFAVQEGWVSVSDDEPPPAETTAKTFLIADKRPALALWQKTYLGAAIVLALIIAAVPLLKKNNASVSAAPYLPVIDVGEKPLYEQQPTPTPLSTNGDSQNRWEFLKPLPSSRAGLGVVAFADKIYAIGGVRQNNQTTRLVEIYDPVDDSWSEGAVKPTAVANISGVHLNGKIYVPGGCTIEGHAIDTLEIYNPQTDAWTQGNSLPEARCGYGLAGLENTLILFGGWDGENFTDTIFIYTVSNDQWQMLDAPLPSANGYMGVTVLDGIIYVVGGYDGKQEFKEAYTFDLKTGRWSKIAPLNEARGGLGLISAAGNLYAVGGGWEQAIKTSEKYNPNTDSWETFESPFLDQWRNAGVTTVNNALYAIGGWNDTDGEYMDSTVSFQVLYQLFIPISSFGDSNE